MKKAVFILLITVPALVVGTGAFLITHFVDKKKLKDEKYKLSMMVLNTHYNDRVALFKEENKHFADLGKRIDIAFLGDSLTEGYNLKDFYPSTYNVVNRGIGGDTTIGLEKRLDSSAYDANPKIVSMLIGANNFDTMLDNYETIVSKLKTNLPETKLVLCSLTSMTGDWAKNNEKAIKNNVEIKKISEKYGGFYADLYNPLLDPNTNELKAEYSVDGGHLTAKGYEVVTGVLLPIFDSILSL